MTHEAGSLGFPDLSVVWLSTPDHTTESERGLFNTVGTALRVDLDLHDNAPDPRPWCWDLLG